MNYNRVCRLEDFDDPELARLIADVTGDPTLPAARIYRKAWEMAMAARCLIDYVPAGSPVLGVGAGVETTLFWATRYYQVTATDLYDNPGNWAATAPPGMLHNPARYVGSDYAWRPERLTVHHRDGRDLRYPDMSFSAVFSSSSIEHFGSAEDVRQAAAEIGRVLKPGGIATIATEFQVSGAGQGTNGIRMFTEQMLHDDIITPSGLTLVDALDITLDSDTLATTVALTDFIAALAFGTEPYPHVVLSHEGYTFTSVHLLLVKS